MRRKKNKKQKRNNAEQAILHRPVSQHPLEMIETGGLARNKDPPKL